MTMSQLKVHLVPSCGFWIIDDNMMKGRWRDLGEYINTITTHPLENELPARILLLEAHAVHNLRSN